MGKEVKHHHMEVHHAEVILMDLQGVNLTVPDIMDPEEVLGGTSITEMITIRAEAEVSISKERKIHEKDNNHVALVVNLIPLPNNSHTDTDCAFISDEL